MAHWGQLPVELKEEIFNFLTPKELGVSVPLVCKEWHQLSRSESLWKRSLEAYYPGTPPENPAGWRLLFKELAQKISAFHWAYSEETMTVDGARVCVAPGVGPWRAAATKLAFDSGVHFWEIKVVNYTPKPYVVSLQIGVLDDGHVETGKLETDILGWIASRPLNYSPSLHSGGETYGNGDVIGLLLHLEGDQRYISYYKNGSFLAHGYRIPPEWERVYPAIALDDGSAVELIPYAYPPYPLPPSPPVEQGQPDNNNNNNDTNFLARAFTEMQIASELEGGAQQSTTITFMPTGEMEGDSQRYEIRFTTGPPDQDNEPDVTDGDNPAQESTEPDNNNNNNNENDNDKQEEKGEDKKENEDL